MSGILPSCHHCGSQDLWLNEFGACIRCGAPQRMDEYTVWLEEQRDQAKLELFPRIRRMVQELSEAMRDGQVMLMYLPAVDQLLARLHPQLASFMAGNRLFTAEDQEGGKE